MPPALLLYFLLVQTIKRSVVVTRVQIKKILQRQTLDGGRCMEVSHCVRVGSSKRRKEVALNDGIQTSQVYVLWEHAFWRM
jgi:hypothetical protein